MLDYKVTQAKHIIFGGAGYIGRYLVHLLQSMYPAEQITIVTRNRDKKIFFDNVEVKLPNEINSIKNEKLVIYNLALELGLGYKSTKRNLITLLDKFEYLSQNNDVEKIIHISSVSVYSKDQSYPVPIKGSCQDDLYSFYKRLSEIGLYKISKKYGIKLIVVRSGNVMGPGSTWANLIANRLINGEPLVSLKRLHPSNTTYVGNLCYCLSLIAKYKLHKLLSIMNFAEFGAVSWLDWISPIAQSLGKPIITWTVSDAEELRPSLIKNLKVISTELLDILILKIWEGTSTRIPILKIISLFNDAWLQKRKKLLFDKQLSNSNYIFNWNEFKIASVFLSRYCIGTEGTPLSIIESLPFSFEKALSSILGWLRFGYFNKA